MGARKCEQSDATLSRSECKLRQLPWAQASGAASAGRLPAMGWHGARGGASGGGTLAHRCRSRLPSPATLLGTAFLLFMGSQLLTTSPFGDLVEVPLTGPSTLTRYAPAFTGRAGARPSVGDGPDIHGYLQPAFTDMDPAMFVSNISSWYDSAVRQVGLAGGEGE